MESFIFNSFKDRFMKGEVPAEDDWKFTVVNSNFEDYQNVKAYRTSADFIKIGGEDKYNKSITEITPVNYYYKELENLDDGYNTNKPMFITNENWNEFYKEYYEYICDWDSTSESYINRTFYGNEAITLHDLFFNYQDTGEVTENNEPIVKNFAKYANFDGFYWVTTKEELAWCADRVNGDVNGIKGTSYNNKIAIVLGDDIGTNDVDNDFTNIQSCIGKYEDRPFEGLLFGNGYSFKSINLICSNNTNGIVGTLGTSGKIHYCTITGNCFMTCKKKISIEHLKDSAADVLAGMLCGKNYGEIYACQSTGSLQVNNFIPSVYCVQNKTEENSSNKNPDANTFYPNYMCINNPGNIIPYIGYFNEGVFGSNSIYQTLTLNQPSGTKEIVCSGCFGTSVAYACSACQGLGYTITTNDEGTTYKKACTACGGKGKELDDNEYYPGRGFSAGICTACDGYGIYSASISSEETTEALEYSKVTSWDLPASAVTKPCPECYGTKSMYACGLCQGDGTMTTIDDSGETIEVVCSACNGKGISAVCPVCKGHTGMCYTTYPSQTYSAFMLKQWAASKGNKLDNKGVKTVKFNELSATDVASILTAGMASKGYVTFYDYDQIAKTMELAGIESNPDYNDALYSETTDDSDGSSEDSNNSRLGILITDETVAKEYSAYNGFSDTNGSKTSLVNATTVCSGIGFDATKDNIEANSLVPVFATHAQATDMKTACVIGKGGNVDVTGGPGSWDGSVPKCIENIIEDRKLPHEGKLYAAGVSAMPYSMLDQSMKLNVMNRAAYYVSPLVGMNKAKISSCYVNENVDSSGTFVGFFGGLAGKQAGGIVDSNTVNINAVENENRDVFVASAEKAIEDNSGVTFSTYIGDCEQLTCYITKSWDGVINIASADKANTTTAYYPLHTDVSLSGTKYFAGDKNAAITTSGRNMINMEMKHAVVINQGLFKNIPVTASKGDQSCSDPLIPNFKGFNMSFSGYSGADYIGKIVVDFNKYTSADLANETIRKTANKAYYIAHSADNICCVGGPGFVFNENNSILTDSQYGYGFVPFKNLTYTEYVNNNADGTVTLNNYINDSPFYIDNSFKVSDKNAPELRTLVDGGNYGHKIRSVNDFLAQDGLTSAMSATLIEHAVIRQTSDHALVNYIGMEEESNSIQWERKENADSVTYTNTEPFSVSLHSFYDTNDTVFTVKYNTRKSINTANFNVYSEGGYKTNRALNYAATKLVINSVKDGVTVPDNFTLCAIAIGQFVMKEDSPVAVETTDYVSKIAQLNVQEINDITLFGWVCDSTNLTRTDYRIHIPQLKNDSYNFIDKCISYVDEEQNKIVYTDRYTRSINEKNSKITLNDIYLRNDAIYGYLNPVTWNSTLPKTYSNIFYYTYYDVNFDDMNDYTCTLYSIRNMGALAGSLVVDNKQYLYNNNAYLNNGQGVTFKETAKDVAPYIHINKFITEYGKTGVTLNYLNVISAGLEQYPNYYQSNASIVYTSKEISGHNGNKIYAVQNNTDDKILIDGIDYTDTCNASAFKDLNIQGNQLFTYAYSNADLTGAITTAAVTTANMTIINGDACVPASATTLTGYEPNGVAITNATNLRLYTLGTGETAIKALGVVIKHYDEETSATTERFVEVFNSTSANYYNNFIKVQNEDTDISAISATHFNCSVIFDDSIPPAQTACVCKYYTVGDNTYFDKDDVNQYYKGTLDAMKPDWKDYSLLDRYGALAAVCEYNTANITDKLNANTEYKFGDETTEALRPITMTGNKFAYHEYETQGEHSICRGPMKMSKYYNALSRHVVGHKLYGIASPLIAEIKPVAKAIPSVFEYNNGVEPGINEAGLFREGEVNQYYGMFTTDMGIRGSSADPYGWVTNIALDTPGSPNYGYTAERTTMLWDNDTRHLASNLFNWTDTKVDPGNITITADLLVTGYDSQSATAKYGKGFIKQFVYSEPYDYAGQEGSYHDEVANASKGLVNINYSAVSANVIKFKYKTDGESNRENVGYGFTDNPVRTITVPYNSFKDTLGNKYPAAIYGLGDITRYKDIDETDCEFDNVSAYFSIYRPDLEQLQNPWNASKNTWDLFKNRKRKNRYPYFGSSIRLLRDDEADFITVPGYNNVRDGKYINDCVPSYTKVTNMPQFESVPNNGYESRVNIPINKKKPSKYTYDKFEYTYDTVAGQPFSALSRKVIFSAFNDKIGYWTQSNAHAGFTNDYVTYSGQEYNYCGNIFNLGYTKLPAEIRTEIVQSVNDYAFTSGISGEDIQGLLVQDSIGNNIMYINVGLGDCNGLNTWSYSAYPSQVTVSGKPSIGCKGLLLEVK